MLNRETTSMGVSNTRVPARAALLGAVAAWLTYISTGDWLIKDYLFVVAVVGVVLFSGWWKAKYERMIHDVQLKQAAHDIEQVEFLRGDPVQLARNKVTCILFFGTWCSMSREALQILNYLHEAMSGEAVQFLGLTQESREELEAYAVKGRNASNFHELKEFPFSIGLEKGFMSKEYLVRCDLFTVPQLFVVNKDKSIAWYGDPCSKGVQEAIRSALAQDDAREGKTSSEITNEAVKQSNAA